MAHAENIFASYKGKPLAELGRLVEKRKAALNEISSDAVVATAIRALTSIRAATKRRSSKKPVRIQTDAGLISLRPYSGYRTSFVRVKGGGIARCLRSGRHVIHTWPGGSPPVIQLVEPGTRAWLSAGVYMISLSERQVARWRHQRLTSFVVAPSFEAARSYCEKRFSKIADKSEGLAKTVLGVAMARVSTRPAKSGKVGRLVAKNAMDNAVVEKKQTKDDFTVRVADTIKYATSAVKGGEQGVTIALMRAANGIAGQMRKMPWPALDQELATPFPEVAKASKRG